MNFVPASKIVSSIRQHGFGIRLGPKGNVQFSKNCPERFKKLVRQELWCVSKWLREEIVSQAWENSGREPQWWRSWQAPWPNGQQGHWEFAKGSRGNEDHK